MTAAEVLGYADDALIAAQRLAEWCARAHDLEDDIALTNIALDQLGAARLLLTYAGELAGAGQTEDELAFLRDDREFRNVLLVELPNYALRPGAPRSGDFGITIAKLLFLSAHQCQLYTRLAGGTDLRLAGIGAKAVKESTYHFDYAAMWTVRLGDGTPESHQRMQDAVDEIWPYTFELSEGAPNEVRGDWLAAVDPVLAEATLTRPAGAGWAPSGGRAGRHTEHLSYLLAEMQVVHRAHQEAQW